MHRLALQPLRSPNTQLWPPQRLPGSPRTLYPRRVFAVTTSAALFDLPHAAVGSAEFSPDRIYRFELIRPLAAKPGPTCVFAMLNPSKADEFTDDATVRRCIHFAGRLGATKLRIVNLYAFCATDPRQLWKTADPIGPGNDTWIRAAAAEARTTNGFVVAAWGTHARTDRVRAVTEMLASTTTIYCLGTTQSGAPRHPLYLPNDTPLQTWPQ